MAKPLSDLRTQGNQLFVQGKIDEAIVVYSAAVRQLLQANEVPLRQRDIDEGGKILSNLCLCLHRCGRHKECDELACQGLNRINPLVAKAYAYWGMSLGELGRPDEGLSKLTCAIWIAPALVLQLRDPLTVILRKTTSPASLLQDAKPWVGKIRMTQTPTMGRGLVAAEPIPSGAIVLNLVHPTSFGAYDEREPFLCVGCGTCSDPPLELACQSCRRAYFCSKACFTRCAEGHVRYECRWSRRLSALCTGLAHRGHECPDGFVDMANHMIITLSKVLIDDKFWNDVLELDHHATETAQAEPKLTRLLVDLFAEVEAERVVRLLSAIRCNSFELVNASGMPVGEALFANMSGDNLNPSLLNHSCRPTCTVDSTNRCVTTIRSVDAGEEMTISYIPQLVWPRKLRQERLVERFYFNCRCSRCISDGSLDRMLERIVTTEAKPLPREVLNAAQSLANDVRDCCIDEITAGTVRQLNEQLKCVEPYVPPHHYLVHDLRNALSFVHAALGDATELLRMCFMELMTLESVAPGLALPAKAAKVRNALAALDLMGAAQDAELAAMAAIVRGFAGFVDNPHSAPPP